MNLEDKYNIDLNNELILTAFTHISYNVYHRLNDSDTYQRLEFLGDKVMDYIISEYLFRNYNVSEGRLSSMLANYVCKKAHYSYSLELGLDRYLRVDPSNYDNLCKNEKIISDIFEAFIGAVKEIYGWDKAKEIVYDIVIPKIDEVAEEYLVDYKTKIVSNYNGEVRFIIDKEEVINNNIVYTSSVRNKNDSVLGVGSGNSKKEAEQEAAKDALENLGLDV